MISQGRRKEWRNLRSTEDTGNHRVYKIPIMIERPRRSEDFSRTRAKEVGTVCHPYETFKDTYLINLMVN